MIKTDLLKYRPIRRLKKSIRPMRLLSVIFGGALGFLFYFLTKNNSSHDNIHSYLLISIVYGMLFGLLISGKSENSK
jgi:hypothetical protein